MKTTRLVAIGNGLFAHMKVCQSLIEQYREKQASCPHPKRDPRGMCYDCGHISKEVK